MIAPSTAEPTWSDRRAPDHLRPGPAVMTNFGSFLEQDIDRHTLIEPGAEQLLAETPILGFYAAWNFAGYIWFEAGRFHCEVWTDKAWAKTATADSLSDIAAVVSARFGAA